MGSLMGGGWSWRRLIFSEYLVLGLSATYFLAVAPFAEGFATLENLRNIVAAMLPLLVVAIGQTYVLIGGGIDLSVTSIIALCSVGAAMVMNQGVLAGSLFAVPAGIAVMLIIGGVAGSFNGVMITRAKMPPFILTLAVMMFASGLAIWLTRSKNIAGLPPLFNALGGKFSIALPLTALLAIGAHCCLSHTLFGRWLYASGHNARAAFVSGVPVNGVIGGSYIISGLCAGAAAILMTGRLETGSPVLGQHILLDVIGATVIGGSSLRGGKGKVVWTAFGVLFIALIDNSLNLLGLSHFAIMMVKGAFILLAALLDSFRSKLAYSA